MNQKEETLLLFHYWMREHNELESGSIVDYRKYVAEYLDENGELDALHELGNHKQAAVNKFRDFKTSEFYSKKTGDSSE